MSNFSEKKFYFLGDFSFFSNEQRDNSIKFHNDIILNLLDDSVDYIV